MTNKELLDKIRKEILHLKMKELQRTNGVNTGADVHLSSYAVLSILSNALTEESEGPAYVWTIAYDNYPDCFEGRLMPNIQGVKVGRDTWYLPVDVIHNLPKED